MSSNEGEGDMGSPSRSRGAHRSGGGGGGDADFLLALGVTSPKSLGPSQASMSRQSTVASSSHGGGLQHSPSRRYNPGVTICL